MCLTMQAIERTVLQNNALKSTKLFEAFAAQRKPEHLRAPKARAENFQMPHVHVTKMARFPPLF